MMTRTLTAAAAAALALASVSSPASAQPSPGDQSGYDRHDQRGGDQAPGAQNAPQTSGEHQNRGDARGGYDNRGGQGGHYDNRGGAYQSGERSPERGGAYQGGYGGHEHGGGSQAYGYGGHGWREGQRMGRDQWRRYPSVDWRSHHLRQPPPGYEWRYADGQYMLGAAATGLITSIIAGGR